MSEGELTPSQYRDLNRKLESVIDALNGKGSELGLRQEVHQLKTRLVGFSKNEDGGLVADIVRLTKKNDELAEKLENHLGAENVSAAGKESRWKTFREIGGFIAIVITLLSSIVAMLTAVRQGL